MYVVDTNNHRIQVFRPGSNIGATVAGYSLGSGASRSELYYPASIVVTPNGTMFILDNYNFRVLRWQTGDQLGFVVAGGRGYGSTFDRMGYSVGIFADNQYNLYLTDQSNHRVVLWSVGNTTAGRLVICSGSRPSSSLFCRLQVAGGNGAGNTPDKLNSPYGIFVDVNGSMFIVDRANHRVQLWTPGQIPSLALSSSSSRSS